MQITPVNNNRSDISKTSEKRYADEAAIALAGMGNFFSEVLNNIQTQKEDSSNRTSDSKSQNDAPEINSERNISEKKVDNKNNTADNSPKKAEESNPDSKETKTENTSEKKSEEKNLSKTESKKSDNTEQNKAKPSTTLDIKSDSNAGKQASEQVKIQDQMDFVKKFENANIKVSVKSEATANSVINEIQNMFMANSNAANIETMSDNVLKSAGLKDIFDGKSFEQIKEIFNNAGSNFSDMSGFNFVFNGQKILDKANNLKFEKVIRTQIKEFASKLTSLVKSVPNSSNATAKMVLRPESLGTVFVDINSTEGVVKLKIKAQSQEVIDKLEAQIAELRQKLEKSGLVADKIEFALYEDSENTFNSFGYSKEKQDEMEARKEFVRSFTGQSAKEDTQEELRISRKNGIEQYI